ncbi:ubiquitin carboxyl-terminal hydrolase CYLD [Gadus macrocephalus]|uniref:ubiquitin carboxyl-terminal hydrolase CYLD n=1 Tax=Gadus macrocephalus TaxID=80720 RepID=UPI0028CBA044|nr:ubiquitin carboxyl-terminal hydrolase CYLD [Gadus macrocephalus]
MENKAVGKEKFFIVTRGKSWKGFSRGCIGRVEEERQDGEVLGLMYTGTSNTGGPNSGGTVKKEDTYPLTRHQAQLLLFVPIASKRVELICDPRLFSAICELSQHDIVMVKYKKGHLPALVKNLMKIGRKENAEDLHMLGFEVEFLDQEKSAGTKKPAPLPLFNAADIVQVVPGYTVPVRPHWADGHTGGVDRKVVSRINSLPNMRTRLRPSETRTDQRITASRGPAADEAPLDVGSMVEVTSNTGATVYGVIRWKGVPVGKTVEWAGIELDYDLKGCSDGIRGGQRYFTCPTGRALFIAMTMCSPDQRFHGSFDRKKTLKSVDIPPDIESDDSEEDTPPISESQAASLLVGRMRGIQGHFNSCYLDATLFSLFCSSTVLDSSWQKPDWKEEPTCQILRKKIVNRLRRKGFVHAESVMSLRKQLGCHTFRTEEKDPEEFISILLQRVLCIAPLLKLRSNMEKCEGAYTYQIILEKEQAGRVPTVQQLLDASFLSCNLKFEEAPSCLILQMPRFGKKYKMFPHIIPSTHLDLNNLLHNAPRECFICGQPATNECVQCLQDRKLQPGKIKQYCSVCSTQVHTHPSRQGHRPRALAPAPAEPTTGATVPGHAMELFAVLCIQTSHYVSFVKYGPDPHSWLFFDSMADRCGDDQSGYNIPEVTACPQLGDFLSQSEEEVAAVDPSRAAEPVRRLLCDSYMFLYQSASVPLCEESRLSLRQQEGGGCEGTDCSQNKATTLTL